MSGQRRIPLDRSHNDRSHDRQRLFHHLGNQVRSRAKRAVCVRDVPIRVRMHRLDGRAKQHQQHAKDGKQQSPIDRLRQS